MTVTGEKMKSGIELEADVVRIDEAQDIALIKVDGKGYPYLVPETEMVPVVGTEIYAIGAPFSESLAFSVTKGVISGLRESEGISYIQTDASLNPGNSGGPLLTSTGKIIGIVSWKISAPGFEGLSFGVPITSIESRLGIEWEYKRE